MYHGNLIISINLHFTQELDRKMWFKLLIYSTLIQHKQFHYTRQLIAPQQPFFLKKITVILTTFNLFLNFLIMCFLNEMVVWLLFRLLLNLITNIFFSFHFTFNAAFPHWNLLIQAEEVALLERQILSDYMTFARASGALEVSL